MSNPLLAARGLVKAHGSTPALRGASVELRAGEILAVTGASGSGKSTLLHCLAGIVRPDEGAVVYGGERLDQLPENRLSELRRTEFGVVFQFGQLIPELTALDNVALPLLLAGTSRKAAQERAGEWLERFGVRGQEESRPGELSGGQAQRVSLARALVTG
ncbi:ATP-binding cassette domain-containing protein, partial [Streptomyces sp. NPDC052015]